LYLFHCFGRSHLINVLKSYKIYVREEEKKKKTRANNVNIEYEYNQEKQMLSSKTKQETMGKQIK